MLEDVDFSNTPLADFGDLINFYAKENNLNPWDIGAIIWIESGGDPNAFNDMSMATGLGQIIPKEYGFTDRPTIEELKNPETNLEWLCKLFAEYYNKYGSRYEALYFYSGGNYWDSIRDYKERYWDRFLEARRFLVESTVGDNSA